MNESIEYRVGLPESCRRRAAELYEEAFRQKFAPIVNDRDKLIEILAESIQPEFALAALVDERLVGLAGFHRGGTSFTGGGSVGDIIKQLGLLRGIWAILLIAILLERKADEGELLMDGIVVDPSMRGKGIGTGLFESLSVYALENGYNRIKLDVVDINVRARRLYESQGFTAAKTTHHPYLKPFMGISSTTTMIKKLK